MISYENLLMGFITFSEVNWSEKYLNIFYGHIWTGHIWSLPFSEALQFLPKNLSQFHTIWEKDVVKSLGINWLILYIYYARPAVRVHMRDEFLWRMYICFNCGYPNKILSKFREISLFKYYIDRFSCSFRVATRFVTWNSIYWEKWEKTWKSHGKVFKIHGDEVKLKRNLFSLIVFTPSSSLFLSLTYILG